MSLLEPGTTLGQRYTLDTSIASGGMGDVWEATDTVLERPVAVKVLRPADPDDTTFIDRFRDEARGSAGLHHPNIAAVYDYGEEDDVAYLVMELVPGRTLGELIRESDGGMAPEDVRSILGQAALALSAAHEAGVVHRDVKPANILVTPEGQAKLTDFGIARIGDGSGHTRAGEVLGTPDYISPEQALGEPATAASDIYSLGIVAHEMLTGLKPFDMGTPVATALAQVNDPPPPLPDTVPQDLREIVDACLAKKAQDRPHDVSAVAAAVGVPLGALPGVTPPPLGSSDATAPLAALDPTRAFTAAHPRTDASGGPARGLSPRWAWLAVPLVLLVAWGAFALGGRMSSAPDPAPSSPPVPSTTGTDGAAASSEATTTTPTTTTPPTTTTGDAPQQDAPAGPPGKDKGKGKGTGN